MIGKSASEMAFALRERAISVPELVRLHAEAIHAHDSKVGAFLQPTVESALRAADIAQRKIDDHTAGPLTGIPIALKDNLCTTGVVTTCASRILEGFVPPYTATAVEQLEAEGLISLGKVNLDEFAMGTSTENSAYQLTRNPWNLEYSPGGSSGGSAACVAAGFSPLALGSDTGGSIRQPAALCGIVGFKPTYGRVSRYGLIAFGSSLDQIGPFARTVEDCALLASVISGHDPRDSTSLPDSKIRTDELKSGSLRGMRFGVPAELLTEGIDDEVRQVVGSAIDVLRKEGACVDEISLPSVPYGVTTYYIIAPAEASSNLARFDGIRYGPQVAGGEGHIGLVARTRGELFGHEVKSRIMIGTYALSAGYYDAYYLRAQQVRGLMVQEFESAFKDYDAILSPTSPVAGFKLGSLKDDPLALKLLDRCTIPANMGGFPSLSLPCGLSQGLPVGLQVTGPVNADERVLQISHCIESALEPLPECPFLAGA